MTQQQNQNQSHNKTNPSGEDRGQAGNVNQDEEQQRNQRDQQGGQASLDVDNEDLQNDEGSNRARKASQNRDR